MHIAADHGIEPYTLQSLPITTSPTMVAFGATKQFSPNCGDFPRTGEDELPWEDGLRI
jgi:hypothetical protein